MLEAPLLLAFTAGMVASVNPCAFSLLPAYVGLFVVGEDRDERLERRMLRAVGVAVAVSGGFVIVFGAAGLVLDVLTGAVRRQIPWVTVAVGVALVVAGVAVISGWKPRLAVNGLGFGSSGRGVGSMIGFGVSYAIASLSCTIGPFLAVTGAALSRSTVGGLVSYVSYALGMGIVILAISVSAALLRPSTAGIVRKASRFAPRAGGVLMVLAGLYGIWYGRWELAVYGGDVSTDPVIEAGEDMRIRLVALVESIGAVTLAAIVLGVTAAAVGTGVAMRTRSHRSEPVYEHDRGRAVTSTSRESAPSDPRRRRSPPGY